MRYGKEGMNECVFKMVLEEATGRRMDEWRRELFSHSIRHTRISSLHHTTPPQHRHPSPHPPLTVYVDEYQTRVVFMVMGGVPGGFIEGRETAKVALGHTWDVALKIHPTWDAVRIEYLRRWTTPPPSSASASDDPRVPLLAWIDFWSGDINGPPWWFDSPLHDFNHSLSVMASYAQRVLVLGDVPTVPIEKVVHDDRSV